jgi:hypothetical protein
MAYKFQLGAYTASGSLTQEGAAEVDALTADSLNVQNGGISNAGAIAGATSIDGSGDLTMGTITMSGFAVDADGDVAMKSLKIDDDSTIGTDSDADMILLDPGADITIASDLDFIIGKAGGLQLADGAVTSTAAELNLLDGVSGLVKADFTKLAAVDADAGELNLLDGAAADTIVNSKAVIYGSSGEVNASSYDLGGNNIISSAGNFQGNNASFAEITGSSALRLSASSGGASFYSNGTVEFAGVVDSTISLTADSLYFKDADGTLKSDSIADIAALLAGNGLEQDGASKVLKVKVDASSIEINSDTLRVKAAGITNAMLADDAVGADELAANAVVNASIAANAAIDLDKLDGGSCASALSDLAQGDLLYAGDVDDSNNIKSITFSNLEDAIFGNISGDATIAAGGALTIANDAVEQAMIADDAVGADQLASNAVVNASVASGAAIDFNKIATNVDMGGNFTIGNQSDDIATFSGPVVVGGNLTVNGALTSINSTTIEITSSFTFEGPADAHETILTCATPAADTTLSLPTLSAGSYFIPALASAATDASAAVTAAEFALLDGGSTVGTDALVAADGFMHNDNGTMKQTQVVKIAELAFSMLSGDATANSAGALTIAADAVESGMLNDNVISGQTELASGAVVDADEMMISDGGTLKKVGLDSLKVYMSDAAAVVQNVAAAGTLVVGVNYFSDMSADGEDAVTLPASAGMTVGQSVKVKAPSDCSAARYITINKAGSQTIDGQASIRLESPFAAVELVYVAADAWRVF